MSACTPIRNENAVASRRSQVASETVSVDLPPANLTFICVSSICVFYLWFSLSVGYLRSRYHERLHANNDENFVYVMLSDRRERSI